MKVLLRLWLQFGMDLYLATCDRNALAPRPKPTLVYDELMFTPGPTLTTDVLCDKTSIYFDVCVGWRRGDFQLSCRLGILSNMSWIDPDFLGRRGIQLQTAISSAAFFLSWLHSVPFDIRL